MAFGVRLWTTLFLCLVAGCGPSNSSPDTGPGFDAGPDAPDENPGPAAPPAEALAPAAVGAVVRPCPEGWAAGESGCAPFAVEPTCTGATAAIPGAAGCVTIGTPCPAGDFAAAPTTGETLYVSATAAAPGDGSIGAPYDGLWRALARATAGTTILLSKGAHVGDGTLRDGVHLRGACAAETSLSATTPSGDFPTLLVTAGHSEVSDLTLRGPRPGIFAVGTGASVTVRGVLIEGVPGAGLLAQGGTIDAEEVVIRDVSRVGGGPGRGADAIREGTLTLRRSTIEATEGGGMLLGSDAQVTLADVLLRDFTDRAISVQDGADLTMDRVAVLRVGDPAININDPGTTVIASDLTIDGVAAAEGQGRALSIGAGARFEATGLAIANTGETAVFVTDPGSVAVVEDAHITRAGERALNAQRGAQLTASRVVLRDVVELSVLSSSGAELTLSDATIVGAARGLRGQTGATLRAQRVRIDGAVSGAVMGTDEGTTVVVEDLEVHGPETVPEGLTAYGAAALTGATLTLRRAALADCRSLGVVIDGETSAAVLEDVQILGTLPHGDGLAGYGLVAQWGGSIDASRVRIERAHILGLLVGGGAEVVARDVVVSSTQPHASGRWGRAVTVEGPGDSSLTVTRGIFEDSLSVGVFVAGEGVSADFTDTVIRRTARRVCATPCIEEGGVGLVSYFGAATRLESFLIAHNEVVGAELGEGGEIDFLDGEVRNQPIGVSVQTPGYDVNRLTRGVHYIDNGANLDSQDLPVPSESPPEFVDDAPPEDGDA